MTQLNIIVNIFCSILIIGILVSCSYTIHYFNKYDSSIFLLNKYKIKKFITDENSELNYKEYYKKLLNFYNPFINSYVSTITTITVLGPLLIINLLNLLMNNKINILKNIQFIIGIIILGLSISFIIAVHYIEYKLNIETYDNKKKKFIKAKQLLINTKNTLIELDDELYNGLINRYKELIDMFDICQTTGYINFVFLAILFITKIYN
tara:strand:+ start:12273 stop:12896 length:624 start_codon:yes stop_codon:yes gene_type:complete